MYAFDDVTLFTNWVGAVPFFWGSWDPIEHKVTWSEAYHHTKWRLSPSIGHWPKIEGEGAVPLQGSGNWVPI